ncbi:hypothetical protein BV22DRAFT_287477 [Leucogyrophana mollusca]|uniref:Uncharacterized protein n=1 Tax=Leucogyrophana mollusca TaxID=85980 RepID=A0ACB8BQZ5_9AGAM|nr:hypothetical protein BV22DRAFT_287477 [Leucogyrophana mollusca]
MGGCVKFSHPRAHRLPRGCPTFASADSATSHPPTDRERSLILLSLNTYALLGPAFIKGPSSAKNPHPGQRAINLQLEK